MNHDITYNLDAARFGAAHPALFSDRMPARSALADGWYELVDQLCTDIERELGPELASPPLFAVEQVKEKYGTLRVYWRLGARGDFHVDLSSEDGLVQSMITEAKPSRAANAQEINKARGHLRELVNATCDASATVCQRCGAAGTLRRLSWIQTLCEVHFDEVIRGNPQRPEERTSDKTIGGSEGGNAL